MNFPVNWAGFVGNSLMIMLAWGFMATAFYSYGGFLAKIIGINITGLKKHAAKIWLGWVFCLFFFAVYHLFYY